MHSFLYRMAALCDLLPPSTADQRTLTGQSEATCPFAVRLPLEHPECRVVNPLISSPVGNLDQHAYQAGSQCHNTVVLLELCSQVRPGGEAMWCATPEDW